MKAGAVAFATGLAALWLAMFGLAALILGYGAVEVVCVELAGVVLALLTVGLLVLDAHRTAGRRDPTAVPSYIDRAEADRLNGRVR